MHVRAQHVARCGGHTESHDSTATGGREATPHTALRHTIMPHNTAFSSTDTHRQYNMLRPARAAARPPPAYSPSIVSPRLELNQILGPHLVEDAVATVAAADGVLGLDLVDDAAVAAEVVGAATQP